MEFLSQDGLSSVRGVRFRRASLFAGVVGLWLLGSQAQADFPEKWGVKHPVTTSAAEVRPAVDIPEVEPVELPSDSAPEVFAATVPEPKASEDGIQTVRSNVQIYRWVDTEGKVHFGDFKALPEKAQELVELSGTQRAATSQALPTLKSEAVATKPLDEEMPLKRPRVEVVEAAAKSSAYHKNNARLCERAQTNLMNVRALMRSGYKANQYEQLHGRERKYMKQRRQYCH